MGRGIPVLGFKSKKDCKTAIKAIVDPYKPTGEEFYHELVAQLFAERHHACVKRQLKPTKFYWGIHPRYGTKECFFIHLEDHGWRSASWNKAIDGWQLTDETLNGRMFEEFRKIALDAVFHCRDSRGMICEYPGCSRRDNLDVHHVFPTFHMIATGAAALLTKEERAALIDGYDWFERDEFLIPEKCLQFIKTAHQTAILQLLCKEHHYAAGRKSGEQDG